MKLKPYVILLFLGIASVIKAQIIVTTPYEFSIGVSGGTTFSSIDFRPKVTQSMLMGTTFGLTGRMTMGKYVGIQVELNYAQQGWKEKFESDDQAQTEEGTTEELEDLSKYKYNRRLSYIQLPFYTRVQFGKNNVKGFINAGPQIGYMISESTDENLNGETPGKINEQHSMPVEKKFEWGISGGAGIEIRTGIGYFLLEGRYLYALGDIYNTTRSDYFSKATGQTISVKISYLIPLK
ncbi:MAG: PorT family protein [Tannerella sp.]|jgi:hypothetical protein|nr:PorT family protein [Tannerella sp.]